MLFSLTVNMRKLAILFLLLLVGCTTQSPDPYAVYNFTYISSIYEITPEYSNLSSDFARGDAALIEARMSGGDPTAAVPYYKKALEEADPQEQAILYETIASITGKKRYYHKAYNIWKEEGNDFHATIDWHLYNGKNPPYQFEPYEIKESFLATPKDTTKFSIGESNFFIRSDDILVSQVDRVTRDWLSSQLQEPDSNNLLTVFSEQYDVEDIGWHEGGRIKQYLELTNATHKPVTGTIVRKIDGTWYAPNEHGVFMFDVPVDKVQYPTTRFFREDLALIIDTHGVNMLVEQAIQENATVVIGCCDNIGKVKAALYLNDKDINVICNTDKFLPLALGQTDKTVGSAPYFDAKDKVRIGYQPIFIKISEKIIVLNAPDSYGLTYYNTPTLYFSLLEEKTTLPLNITYVTINDFDEMGIVTDTAREEHAQVIAARSYTEDDYQALSVWLEENKEHRLVLFHSEAYPYGYLLYRNYPFQVTFDDIMPQFY